MENVYRYLYGIIRDRLSGTVACKGLHAGLMNFMILSTDQCQYHGNSTSTPPVT